jgi:PAS domain S-box-containing protein
LLVEDSEDDALLLLRELQRAGLQVEHRRVDTSRGMRLALEQGNWDIIIADYSMPRFSGMSALSMMQKTGLDIPFILVSGTIGEELAVAAMKAGASDYLMKDELTRLAPAVQRELQEAQNRRARRQAEEELRALKEFHEDIVQNIFDGILVDDEQQVLTFINPAGARMLGYEPAELIGQYWTRIVSPDQYEVVRQAYQRRIHAQADRYELLMLRKDGATIPVLISGAPRMVNGRFAGTIAVFTDISERKKIEEELVKLKEFNEGIIQNMYEGVGVGDEDGYWTFVNPAMARMLGYRVEELIGQHWRETVPPDQQEIVSAADSRRREGKTDRYEVELLRKNGTRLIVEVSGSPIEQNGQFRGSLVVFTDITARKQAEQSLRRRAAELAALHAASLTVTAPHDIHSLVHSIIEQAKVLLKAPVGGLSLCYPERKEIRVLEEVTPQGRSYSGLVFKYGEGAVGWVAAHGKPLITEDYRTWPNRAKVYEDEKPYYSLLSVPLMWRNQVIGVLQVGEVTANRVFTQEDLELLSLFADQAAIALENARLFEAERSIREQAETMREAAQVLSSSLELDTVLRQILNQIKRVLVFDTASVLLYGSQGQPDSLSGIGYNNEIATSLAATSALRDSRILARMAKDHQPVLIPDVREHPDWIWVRGAEHVRSFMGAPIMLQDQMMGALMVDNVKPGFYDEDDLCVLQTMAQHMSIAIQNARLYEAEHAARARAEALREAARIIGLSLSLDEVLRAVLEQLSRVLPFDSGSTMLVENNQIVNKVWQGYDPEFTAESIKSIVYDVATDQTCGAVVRTGQPLIIQDVHQDPRWTQTAIGQRVSSWMGVPLIVRDQVIGLFSLDRNTPSAFTEADVALAQTFASHAATAIENARLFERATAERRHLSLLYDLGRELAATMNYDEILSKAISLTCKALGGIIGEAFLFDPETNTLKLRSLYGQRVDSLSGLDQNLLLEPGKGLAGWAALHRQGVNVPDVRKDPRWLVIRGIHEDVHSAIVAPILDNERLLGVLTVLHRSPGVFTADHLDLLTAICHQVSLAINNAESYLQVQSLVVMLADEQYRLESLLERLPVGVLLLDADYRLLVANLLGREILARLNPKEPGQILTHLGPYTLQEFCALFDAVEPNAEMQPIEIVVDTPYHSVFETEARPIGGETRQYVLTLRDVTLERENQERISLQERLATVGQLAAGIAHDFNNIMAAILVYTDLLMNDKGLSDPGRERLGIIQQQVQRATSLIRQILDFSRRSVMEQIPMDLLPFVKELDRLLSRVLPETIRLELNYQPGNYMISADPTRLQQVFMNLALNARDAMPDGGTLRFELSRFSTASMIRQLRLDLPPGDWVRIEVADTGEGIAPEVLPHIFDPFFTTKPVGKGTGLGLAQVYGIIKQHQGHIDVISQLGLGSQFIIYLPALAVQEDTESVGRETSQFDGGGQTVLVVEDDQSTREAMKALLQSQNFHVVVASNGQEALRILEAAPAIGLVISDMVMPEMGGVALYRSIQERWVGVKVLFVTGHPLDREDQELLEEGGINWLQKPFSVQEFNQAIQALIK